MLLLGSLYADGMHFPQDDDLATWLNRRGLSSAKRKPSTCGLDSRRGGAAHASSMTLALQLMDALMTKDRPP